MPSTFHLLTTHFASFSPHLLDITFWWGASQGSGLSMEPNIFCMKGHHLKEEMKFIARWRETQGLLPDEDGSK
jgi:hypothetical protein